MQPNQEYKNRALASLEGRWSTAVIAALIYLVINEGTSFTVSSFIGDKTMGASSDFLWAVICLPFGWGYTIFFLNLIRNSDTSYERLFDGYKDFVRIFLGTFLPFIATLIGFFLFIIPGIIIAMMYSQVEYIMKDDKEISAGDALKKSAEMMKGHKWELFWLMFSFIGWFILCVLTLGIGFLFLEPYFQTTMAHYYEDLKAEQVA